MNDSSPEPRRRTTPRWILIAIAVVLAFLAGMATQYGRGERLASQLHATQGALAIARLEATLGAAALEAQRQNYEPSRQLASEFFTDLQRNAGQMPPEMRIELQRILSLRDATITMLSRRDPESGNVLAGTLARYRGVVGRVPPPTSVPPAP
jgi:hypothetical protein